MASKSAILSVRILGDAKGATDAMNSVGDKSGGLVGKLKGIGPIAAAAFAAVAGAAVAAGGALFKIGETFDDVEDTIRVGTGATGDALDGLVDAAHNVATSVPVSFEEAGTIVADLNTRLGLTGETVQTVASQYSEAGRILGETIDIQRTSAAFNAFKIQGGEVEGAMDHLFRVSQATGVGMNHLADAVATNSPALQELGFSFEDATALVGGLDKAGLDSTKTMASMTKGLVTLAKDGEKPADAFDRTIGEIGDFITAGDKAAALNVASKIFGTRGASQFVAAVEAGTLSLDDLQGGLGLTSDTILGVGQETMDAAEKWEILKNKGMKALEPLASAVFDGVGKALDWVMGAVEGFSWDPIVQGASTLTDGLSWIGPLAESIGQSLAQLWQFGAGVFAQLQAAIEPTIPTIQAIVTTVGEIIRMGAELITELVAKVTQGVLAAWQVIGGPIMGVVSTTWKAILGVIRPVMTSIKGIIRVILSAIRGDWSGVWRGIQQVASGVWRTIVGLVRGNIRIVRSVIVGAVTTIANLWRGAWGRIGGTVTGAWRGIRSGVSGGINSVVGFFRSLPGRIVGALGSVYGHLSSVGRNMMSSLANALSPGRIISKMRSVIGDAIGFAKRLLGIASPSKVFTEIGRNVVAGIPVGIERGRSALTRSIDRMVSAIVPEDVPTIPVRVAPTAGTSRAGAGSTATRRGSGAGIVINVNGALDPTAVARQIRDLLNRDARVRGIVDLGGRVIA